MSGASSRMDDTYELQNDQRLDELHSKIRTLRGVTTDIHNDVERQNLMLDDTGNHFTSFGDALGQSARRAGQVFGIKASVKTWRIAMYVVFGFFGLWLASKIFWWWRSGPEPQV